MWHYPDFVRVFHTSSPLRSVELSKERQRLLGWGKSAKKCDIILTLLCQTIPHSLPFPYPDYLSARFARRFFFFAHAGFFSFFLPMRSLDLGYWDFDSLSFKIVQNFSVIISWKAALTANVHHICYKLSCMSGQTLCISEVKKYRCAFPLLPKLLSFRYIFEKRHTLNSLLTETPL